MVQSQNAEAEECVDLIEGTKKNRHTLGFPVCGGVLGLAATE